MGRQLQGQDCTAIPLIRKHDGARRRGSPPCLLVPFRSAEEVVIPAPAGTSVHCTYVSVENSRAGPLPGPARMSVVTTAISRSAFDESTSWSSVTSCGASMASRDEWGSSAPCAPHGETAVFWTRSPSSTSNGSGFQVAPTLTQAPSLRSAGPLFLQLRHSARVLVRCVRQRPGSCAPRQHQHPPGLPLQYLNRRIRRPLDWGARADRRAPRVSDEAYPGPDYAEIFFTRPPGSRVPTSSEPGTVT